MKLQVTQGHEKGIGIEVFLKSCLMMSDNDLSFIHFNAFKDSILDTLETLKLPYNINSGGLNLCRKHISVNWLKKTSSTKSFHSLCESIESLKDGDVLFTLPTSKDQFPHHAGHTEFFRHNFKLPDLGMYFSSPSLKVLLISDHISLKEVVQLTEETIYLRTVRALEALKNSGILPDRVLFSGFNPHAGENGLIGQEDSRVGSVIKRLSKDFNLELSGPYPGDTMLFEKRSSNDLLVYIYHDQGLGVFKSLQGFIGSNITLGLPFLRFSPDHGTSFGLFGKNSADYRGCAYSLGEALVSLKKVTHGKNSSHQSESTQSKKHRRLSS